MTYRAVHHFPRVDASPLARAVGLALGSALSVAATVSDAADWNYDPKVALSYEYDDNDRLTSNKGEEIEVSGPKLDARIGFTAATPTTTFLIEPRYRGTYYFEGEEDNSNDGFLRMALRNKGQRLESYLLADWSTVITLGNYFPSAQGTGDGDLGNPPTGETVPYVAGKNRRDQWRISPGATYQLTERQSIGVNAEYLDTNFRKYVPGDDVDYQNLYVGGNYSFKTSPTSDLAIVAGFSKYEPEDGGYTDYWNLAGEWRKRWTETSEVFFRAGSSFVKSDEPGFESEDWSSGFTGGAGVRWAWEVTTLFLDATQYMNPTSQGGVVTRSQVRFEVQRQLSQMMTFTAAARYIDDSEPPGNSTYNPQTYVNAGLGLRWRFARAWSAFGAYNYRWKERDDAQNDARSNGLSLGVIWEPMRK